jgi:MFS transporter, DHA1 family, multidrug resistance protein
VTRGEAAGASDHRVTIFIVVGALTGIAPLSIDAYIPGLPVLTSDLGTGASTGQLALTAFLLGLALSQVVAGSISDNIGRRTPVMAGLLAYLVSSLLCGSRPISGR